MTRTAARMIGVAIASQLLCACASPQLVSYRLEDSTTRQFSTAPDNYLPKVVVKTSGKPTGESVAGKERFDVRYY